METNNRFKFLQTNRKRRHYVLSKALALGIKHLTKEVNVFTKDDTTKQDLQDMQELYNWVYPSYVPTQGWGGKVQRLTPIESHLSTQLDPTGGYYGT